MDGEVYSDASGCYPKCPHRRRIAYSVIAMRDGVATICASAPLDCPLQTLVAGELKASALAA